MPLTPLMKQCIGMGYDKELVEAAAARKRRSGGRCSEIVLREVDTLDILTTIFTKGNSFCDFLFVFL